MDDSVSIDTRATIRGSFDLIDSSVADALTVYPLSCISTTYPHFQYSVESAESTVEPRRHHPIFFGCFDWHSAVHSHWCLIRLLRLGSDLSAESDIRETIDSRITPENVDAERTYFEENPSFERPYGWAWFLRLIVELELWEDPQAGAWRDALRPLETLLLERIESTLLARQRPFYVGTHGNSAFALNAVSDYAVLLDNDTLADNTATTIVRLYESDTQAPIAYEPFGWDFISPSLTQANCLRRVLEPPVFADWFSSFIEPSIFQPGGGFDPITPTPATDGSISLHYTGLNLARAWCLASFADQIGEQTVEEQLRDCAERHASEGLSKAFTGDYGGSHWLSSFVLYLLTRTDGGIGLSHWS